MPEHTDQLNLFGPPESPQRPRRSGGGRDRGETSGEVGPAAIDEDVCRLGERLPASVRFGTSSWSFPGWEGLVFDRKATKQTLSRRGLAAYAGHPLLRAVSLDRTYYGPIGVADFSEYADQVPEAFRFLVKAHELLTVGRFGRYGRYADRAGQKNEMFLDALYAEARIVAPMLEGLGEKAGPLVFQFPPQGLARYAELFLDRLHAFLTRLPKGPAYAVEVRESGLLTSEYRSVLEDTGAVHCVSVHPNMPPVAEQAVMISPEDPLVVRWMLHGGFAYEAAKERYEPFDRLVDEDPTTRESLAELVADALGRSVDVYVLANNKAEGSAPLTVGELARSVVGRIEAGLA